MTKVYRADCTGEADLKVYVTDVRFDADLIVFETTDEWAATEPEIWYYTGAMSRADRVICFTESRWEADLIIYETRILPDAGWIDETKAHLL